MTNMGAQVPETAILALPRIQFKQSHHGVHNFPHMTLPEPSIAVILPAYNEAATVAETMRSFHAALPQAELIVVNNNSQDDTAAIATKTLRELGARGRVLLEPRQGKGNAVRRAFL